ncbi:MAG: histidine kinase dimerization/phospho-acceptor domain-containing protein, partial [Oscillospiraceae bacterium]
VDASTLESHLNRPEVARALTSGYAQSQRMSDTLGARTYYCAVRLDDDSVVRLARTTDSVFAAVTSAATLILLIAGGVFLLALVLADRMTEHLVAPLNALDLEHPDLDSVYGELSPLLLRIERQNRQIEQQINILSARQEEFNAITGNMAEGLALLDAGAAILTVNSSALRLLDLPGEDYAGRSYLALNRSLPLQGAVNAALAGEHRSTLLALGGKSLQLYASPVLEGESTRGALLLILDVTAREQAEQLRREFSANVSHELKTPLTSISGCAEMMKNGMVRPEDISAFSQRIFQESGRLIALIEDIIRISALDEHSVFAPKETVELAALAACVAERLAPQAAAAGVSITVEGGPVPVQAVAQMMDELLYNLCENAVKYNRPGGTVDIALSRQGARAVIEVSD